MGETKWHCQKCSAWGRIKHGQAMTIKMVEDKIKNDHEIVSPKCTSVDLQMIHEMDKES